MSEESKVTCPRRFPLWRKRILVVAALVALIFGGYHYLTRSSNVTALATQVLSGLTGAEVSVRSASFSINGEVVLNDVTIDRPNASGPARRICEGQRVVIHYDHWRLFLLKFVPRRIEIPDPKIFVTYDTDQKLYNFQYEMARAEDNGDAEAVGGRGSIPEVILSGGEIRFAEVSQGHLEDRGSIPIVGYIRASDQADGISTFDLQQVGLGKQIAPRLSGVIDLKQGSIQAELSQVKHEMFDSPQGRVLLGPISNIWRQMQPTGSVPRVRFGYDPDPAIGFYADIIVEDIAMMLPFTDGGENRISDVAGHFVVDNQQVSPDLKGRVSTEKFDFDYQINGSLQGFAFDTPFEFSVFADGQIKDILHEGEDLWPLPKNIENIFSLYNITGGVKVHVKVMRSQPGDKVTFDGSVFLKDCQGMFARFPYPLKHINGEIRFDDKRVELVAISGNGLHGGDVMVTGLVEPPVRYPKSDINVTGVDVPIDQLLYDALPDRVMPILDLFLNHEAARALYQQGVIQTQAEHDRQRGVIGALEKRLLRLKKKDEGEEPEAEEVAAQLAAAKKKFAIPVFELGGLVSVQTKASRPLGIGQGQKFSTVNTIDLSGVSLLCKFWPYPLRVRKGTIVVSAHHVEILDIEFEGFSGAQGVVTGFVDLPGAGQMMVPNIDVTATGVPVDDLLIASIPSPHDQLLRDQHINGTFDAEASVFLREDGEVDFQVKADLDDATARPYMGEFALDHVDGRLVLQRDDVIIEALHGRRGEATLDLKGHAQWIDDKAVLDLVAEAKGLRFDDPVLDLMRRGDPEVEAAREIIASYQPTGQFDAKLDYRIYEDRPAEYVLTIEPLELGFNLHDSRIEMSNMDGRVNITPDSIELDQVQATYGSNRDGYVKGSGQVKFGKQLLVDVVFDAGAPMIDSSTAAMLPTDVRGIIEQMQLQCGFEVKQGRLMVGAGDDGGQAVDFRGNVILENATAEMGVPITEMNGRMLIEAHHDVAHRYPLLHIDMQADRLRILDRLVEPLSATISSTADGRELEISDIRGWCYGGLLTGRGRVELDNENVTKMHIELVDSNMEAFIHPLEHQALLDKQASGDVKTEQQAAKHTGYLSTNLSIEIHPANPEFRHGRGRIEVHEAELYEFPVTMAVMQIVNLTFPQASSFDRATVSYLIDGDNIEFDRVSLNAPTLEIVGTGKMHFKTLALEMDLVSRNPGNSQSSAVTELVDVFKDELLSIKVTGTLNDPQAAGESFTGIKSSLRNIFGEEAEKPKQNGKNDQVEDGGANKSDQ